MVATGKGGLSGMGVLPQIEEGEDGEEEEEEEGGVLLGGGAVKCIGADKKFKEGKKNGKKNGADSDSDDDDDDGGLLSGLEDEFLDLPDIEYGPRNKKETAEEKRARKKAVKDHKQACRRNKKETKQVFAKEERKLKAEKVTKQTG